RAASSNAARSPARDADLRVRRKVQTPHRSWPRLAFGRAADLAAPMAGVEGFEPSYGGIKTRCLTTWRHPNGIWTHTQVRNLSRSGETFKPRATKLRQASGTRAAIRSASAALAHRAKMQEPVPVNRAGARRASQSSASATSGYIARTTGSQSFRPPDSKKARIVMRGVFRVNSGAWKTRAVGTATPGCTMT